MENLESKFTELSVERKDGAAVVTFEAATLRRPFLKELWQAMQLLESDPEIRILIFTGRKNIFMTGADLKEIRALKTKAAARQFLVLPHSLVRKFCCSKKILIAAINGYCLGGGLELALACDIRIASREVRNGEGRSVPYIGFPETELGLVPAVGGAYLAAQVIGLARAKELFLRAEPINADQAQSIGLVNAVVDGTRLLEEAQQLARGMLVNSLPALLRVKRLLRPRVTGSNLGNALRETAAAFAQCCVSNDTNERIRRVSEERRLRFRCFAQAG
jgi:enoyl-CoA hydratase